MIQRFTDTEYAIIVDCLSSARDQMHSQGHETPNIESALAKFHSWATPAGCEFTAVTGEEARALEGIETAKAALTKVLRGPGPWTAPEVRDALEQLGSAAPINPGGLKVFGWAGHRHGRQTREIVAAPTRTAAIRLSGLTVGEARHGMHETRNEEEIATALGDAGTVFWRDLVSRREPFRARTP